MDEGFYAISALLISLVDTLFVIFVYFHTKNICKAAMDSQRDQTGS